MRGRSGVVVEEELSARTAAAAAPEMDVGVRVRGAASRVVERRAVWRR